MFAGKLRAQRIAAGMTVLQLARASNVAASTISRAETGASLPGRATLSRLLKALGTDFTTAERIRKQANTLRSARRALRQER